MTKLEAIRLMEQEKKVTHRYFSAKEFATIKNGQIVTEEGYSVPMKEFWAYRNVDAWNDGWEEFVEPIPTPPPASSNPHEQILQLLITGGFLDPGKLKEARDIIGKCAPSPGDKQSLEDAAEEKYPLCAGKDKAARDWNDRTEIARNAFIAGAFHERADESQMKRLYDWIMDENRKPATTFFTSGWLRNVAKEIEFRLSSHSFNKESFLKALREGNPYHSERPAGQRNLYKSGVWKEVCNKAAELLNQKEEK